jgi:hypothetical protein
MHVYYFTIKKVVHCLECLYFFTFWSPQVLSYTKRQIKLIPFLKVVIKHSFATKLSFNIIENVSDVSHFTEKFV